MFFFSFLIIVKKKVDLQSQVFARIICVPEGFAEDFACSYRISDMRGNMGKRNYTKICRRASQRGKKLASEGEIKRYEEKLNNSNVL